MKLYVFMNNPSNTLFIGLFLFTIIQNFIVLNLDNKIKILYLHKNNHYL